VKQIPFGNDNQKNKGNSKSLNAEGAEVTRWTQRKGKSKGKRKDAKNAKLRKEIGGGTFGGESRLS